MNPPPQTGSDLLLKSLLKEGVKVIFGYPGGAVLPLYDVLPNYPDLKHILVRNEQGAALAADGYARVTQKPGVCIATSGPGATNLVTGIFNAYMDSIPIICLTGQVPIPLVGSDAFQEVDITGLTEPITKHNYLIEKPQDIPTIIKEAFFLAKTGRPGPILIDFPKDTLGNKVKTPFRYPQRIQVPGYKPCPKFNPRLIKQAVHAIQKAKKPVFLVGHGVVLANAAQEATALAEKLRIPVTPTLLGLGAIPQDHPLNLGMLGMHGHAHANFAAHHADLILNIGSRFDDRITGKTAVFGEETTIIHVDIDSAEINKIIKADIGIVGDAKAVLKALLKQVQPGDYRKWWQQIKNWQTKFPYELENHSKKLTARDCISEINRQNDSQITVVTDVGQHQMWTAQIYKVKKPHRWLSSGGAGTMGYGLPAAIGAAMADPKTPVWLVSGDGSLQMNIQELMTIASNNLNIKIAVTNNSFLGMVRQWQELFYNRNYSGTPIESPDYLKIAAAYGIKAFRAKDKKTANKIIQKAKKTKGPVLMEFLTDPEDNVLPMVPAGQSLGETMTKIKPS